MVSPIIPMNIGKMIEGNRVMSETRPVSGTWGLVVDNAGNPVGQVIRLGR
jgi:hypothetical protein